MRSVGTVARGIRTPLIQIGDDLVDIVVNSLLEASSNEGFEFKDRDIVGITESAVARSQRNFATIDQMAKDIKRKYPSGDIGIIFPIISRNRFSTLLQAIANGCDKLYIMLSYPSDEVGNELITWDMLDKAEVNPYTDVLSEIEYRRLFGYEYKHPFTGLDYVEYYKSFGEHIEIIFANDPRSILKYTKNVLCCDIHTRHRNKRILKASGAEIVYGLDDILTESIDGSGYNEQYGLLGSNKSTDASVKLFPRDCEAIVYEIQDRLYKATGKQIEVLVYGDGAFKDPVGGIWELADPVVSPGFTKGLIGTPNEIKLKYVLDNELADKSKEEALSALNTAIKSKNNNLGDKALGTTPRQYTDLIGSLCDLMSGSGDKGTPVVHISGYFDNRATE